MALEQELRRAERSRDQVGDYLDELEQRFAPGNLAKVGAALARASARRHPVAWAIGAAIGVTAIAGIVTWALISSDNDE
ncbi:hypothetical protein C3B54_11212 [Pontimonas salivibrio]|uniref:DUF3618 domain-containing protein n=1 Tax=Pontimonas salivibrio TaxID=1159327 RepID=A0A2L2BNG6_9MICO|nr:hypothetical protein [Pontimonas salivibrio]AVG23215.1 hypothetical protein C3B54_11212 [Pontimonas salivibrio]